MRFRLAVRRAGEAGSSSLVGVELPKRGVIDS